MKKVLASSVFLVLLAMPATAFAASSHHLSSNTSTSTSTYTNVGGTYQYSPLPVLGSPISVF